MPKLSSTSSSEKPGDGSFDSPLEVHRSSEGTKAGSAPCRCQRAVADCHNELEIGVLDVPAFINAHTGRALIHFGASVSHPAARVATLGHPMPPGAIVPASGPATNDHLTDDQFTRMAALLDRGLDAGALGIGMGLAYTPGATRLEVIRAFRSLRLAASRSTFTCAAPDGSSRVRVSNRSLK